MPSIAATLASLLTAGTMLISGSLDAAAPQNNDEGLLFLVNRQWMVSQYYSPVLRKAEVPGQLQSMREDASYALEEMYAACAAETGKTLNAVSGYRSYAKQQRLYNNKLKSVNYKTAKADEYVARPGASEHHLGMAMDVGQKNTTNLTQSFGSTAGGKWVRENCWRFGFVLRYEENWEAITGYKFEPWHVRYVGKEIAARIHDDPMPLETFLLKYREQVLLDLFIKED